MKQLIIILSIFMFTSCGIFKTAKNLLTPSIESTEALTPHKERKIAKQAKKSLKRETPKLTRKEKKSKKALSKALELDPTIVKEDIINIFSTDTSTLSIKDVVEKETERFINDIAKLSENCDKCIRLFKERLSDTTAVTYKVSFDYLKRNPLEVKTSEKTKYGIFKASAFLTIVNNELKLSVTIDTSQLKIPTVVNYKYSDAQRDSIYLVAFNKGVVQEIGKTNTQKEKKRGWMKAFWIAIGIILLMILIFIVGKRLGIL